MITKNASEKLGELENLLDNPASNLVTIVQLAARVAILCKREDYSRLFQIHLEGVTDISSFGHTGKKLDGLSTDEKKRVVAAVFADRKLPDPDERIMAQSLSELEWLQRNTENHFHDAARNKRNIGSPELQTILNLVASQRNVINRIRNRVNEFVREVYRMSAEQPGPVVEKPAGRIFIGHGHSRDWLELNTFLEKRLKLPTDEFNRESPAGRTHADRLLEMINDAALAFLVMTAEDEHDDGKMHARENVIHEAG